MGSHTERRIIPSPPHRVFELVADVESYPAFVPMWSDARKLECAEDSYHTEQVVRFGLLQHRFRSHTTLERPHRINVTSGEGPFRQFDIRWEFQPDEDDSCHVSCSVDYQAYSLFLQGMLDVAVMQMTKSIVSAFENRARELHAATSGSLAA